MAVFASRVINIFNKKTSMRLTLIEWDVLDNICRRENIKRSRLLELIEQKRNPQMGLTQSVRLFVLVYLYRQNMQQNLLFSTTNTLILSSLFEISK